MLHTAGGSAAFRACQIAADPNRPAFTFHRDKPPAEFVAVHRKNRRQQVAAAGGGQLCFPVPDKLKGDFRVGKCQPVDEGGDRRPLGAVLFEELHSGGHIVKKVFHGDGRPYRAARLGQLAGAFPGQRVPRPDLLGSRAGQYFTFTHGADGGQRLPAEAQRPDAIQVLRAQHLAGGVPQKCLRHILPFDPAAVIGHTDEPYPAVLYFHRNGGRPGINGILHQLLHHRSRAFYHLARCDQLRRFPIQYVDFRHRLTSFLPFFMFRFYPGTGTPAAPLSLGPPSATLRPALARFAAGSPYSSFFSS